MRPFACGLKLATAPPAPIPGEAQPIASKAVTLRINYCSMNTRANALPHTSNLRWSSLRTLSAGKGLCAIRHLIKVFSKYPSPGPGNKRLCRVSPLTGNALTCKSPSIGPKLHAAAAIAGMISVDRRNSDIFLMIGPPGSENAVRQHGFPEPQLSEGKRDIEIRTPRTQCAERSHHPR
jgi:hypothetical protein